MSRIPEVAQAVADMDALHKRYQEVVIDAYVQLDTNKRQAALLEQMADALAKVGQSLAWQFFGECRSYGSDVPLLMPHEADKLAKATLNAYNAHGIKGASE